MANFFAYIAFFMWPIFILFLLKKHGDKKAIFIAFTLCFLLLPKEFDIDLPLFPPLERESITALSFLIFLPMLGKKFRIFQTGKIARLMFLYFIVLLISTELNDFSITRGSRYLPSLTHYDAISSILRTFIWMIPLFIGRHFFMNAPDSNRWIFKTLVAIALIYSIPMLFEVRMSPQLHLWVYGFDPSGFLQNTRGDGYRPSVLVGHGLPLAFWFSICVIAACVLVKTKTRIAAFSPKAVLFYMFIVLVFCKTWSAMLYALMGLFLIFAVSPKQQVRIALVIALLACLYPISKITDTFPDREVIALIKQYSPDRAQSLDFRFQNEDILLKRAMERPFFGWGGWGRNRVFGIYGKDDSVTDGRWILELGINGILGLLCFYLLFLIPMFYANKAIKFVDTPEQRVYLSTMALMLAICIVDSIPNYSFQPVNILLAGILLGQSEFFIKNKMTKLPQANLNAK